MYRVRLNIRRPNGEEVVTEEYEFSTRIRADRWRRETARWVERPENRLAGGYEYVIPPPEAITYAEPPPIGEFP